MNTSYKLALALAAILGGVSTAHAAPGVIHAETSPDRIEGQYIVTLNKDTPTRFSSVRTASASELDELTAFIVRQYKGERLFYYKKVARGFAARLSAEQAKALSHDPRIAAVEQSQKGYLYQTTQTNPGFALDRVDQRTGNAPTNTYVYENTGSDANAYIIDSGIRATHTEFINPIHGGPRAYLDFTVINDGRGASDCNGHGTAVAALVGGTTFGVAKLAALRAYRVADCAGNLNLAGVLAAIDAVMLHWSEEAARVMALPT